jgi:DNA-binding beta-propeller fold protein YncE
MDTPQMTLGTLPGETGLDEAPHGAPGEPAPPAEEEREDTRRRKLLLLLLFLLLLVFVSLSIWYLLFRKPITEIPLPIAPEAMPTYQYALYDLDKPQGVAVSADGERVYVTQNGAAMDTLMLDRQGATLGVLKPPESTLVQPHQLYVAVNPVTGEVWATDRYDSMVLVYAADGTFLRTFDPGATLAGWQPLGIGFDKQGNAYIADVGGGSQRIHVFGADGTLVRDFGAGDSLDHPNAILVADDGTVYVTDTANGRLLVFDATGTRVGIVARGEAEGNLGLPVGLALDDKGHVLVVDSSASQVQAYAPMKAGERAPAYLGKFGVKGTTDGALSFPNGLATDSRGRIYVADWGNDRLQVWSY